MFIAIGCQTNEEWVRVYKSMRRSLLLLILTGLLTACALSPQDRISNSDQDRFFQSVSKLCGQAFAGKMVTDHPTDSDLKGKAMIMHVRSCTAETIKIPLHVEDDRSRTWVVTRTIGGTEAGIELKHDHRHADGSEDEVTQYGGRTLTPGTATRQEFPADAFSKALFEGTGRPNSSLNTWGMEIEPGKRFIYEVTRPNRHVRFEFDLSQPITAPPPPWGTPSIGQMRSQPPR